MVSDQSPFKPRVQLLGSTISLRTKQAEQHVKMGFVSLKPNAFAIVLILGRADTKINYGVR